MKKLLPLCFTVLLLISACSQNRKAIHDSVPSAEPNFRSAYLFSMASAVFFQGDYNSADVLYRLALVHDPQSLQINKQILQTNVFRMNQEIVSPEAMVGLIDSLSQRITFDEDMLNNAYVVYTQIQDVAKQDQMITELTSRYPSARNYLVRYFHDMHFQHKVEIKTLDKAFAHAGDDLESLKYIAQLYTELDPQKAIPVMEQIRRLHPTEETDAILIRLLMVQEEFSKARKLFEEYRYPEDLALMNQFIDIAMSMELYDEIFVHSQKILNTASRELIQRLVAAAFIDNNGSILRDAEQKIMILSIEDSEIYAILVAEYLESDKWIKTDYSNRIHSIRDMDSVVMLALIRLPGNYINIQPQFTESQLSSYLKKLEKLKDPILRTYLQSYAQIISDSGDDEEYVKAKYALVNQLLSSGKGMREDYNFLLQYYYLEGEHQRRITLLHEALNKYPEDPLYLNDLGYTLLVKERAYEQAYSLISKALQYEPDNPHYLDSMAWYHYLHGDYDKALELMQIPLQMGEMPSEIAYHLGLIYQKLGDNDSSVEFFELAAQGSDEFGEKAKQELLAPGSSGE